MPDNLLPTAAELLDSEEFCTRRIAEQAEYIRQLLRRRMRGQISEEYYQEKMDSAKAVKDNWLYTRLYIRIQHRQQPEPKTWRRWPNGHWFLIDNPQLHHE